LSAGSPADKASQPPDHPIPWLLTISDYTNLADCPLTGVSEPSRIWSDSSPRAVYNWCLAREAESHYPQRTTETSVLALAHELGVNTTSLNTPIIFGEGEGLLNRQGIIIPTLMRYTLTKGYGFKLNDTANFDWVHVADLADAFVLLVKMIREGRAEGEGGIPVNKDGIVPCGGEGVADRDL